MFYGMHISIILGTIIAFMWESKNYFIVLKLVYAFWYVVTFFYLWSKGYGFINVLTQFYFFWAEFFFVISTLIFILPWILSFLREPWSALPKPFVELIKSFGRLFITMYIVLFFSFLYCYVSSVRKYGEIWWKECIIFNNKYFFVQYDFLNHVDLFDWINLIFY
jgi:signal transduction histidine kinase